jgi:hypothetical protein
MIQSRSKFLAIGTAAAILASASTASVAAPIGIGSGQLSAHTGAVSDVTPVSWEGRRNTAIALGVLGGLAVGGAAARAYSYPYYAGGYYGSPYYYAPPPPRRQCWVQTGPYRGQGYYTWC